MAMFTVVGLCRCGCEESFIMDCEALTADDAARSAIKSRLTQHWDSDVFAAFPGTLENELSVSIMSKDNLDGI